MKECSIRLFAPEVRAILEGRKTQTRRVVKPQPTLAIMERVGAAALRAARAVGLVPDGKEPRWRWKGTFYMPWPDAIVRRCPYGSPGTKLWVRETWAQDEFGEIFWAADHHIKPSTIERWKPSIHMPRRASRITLEVTGVRVERLRDITEEDAWSEGVFPDSGDSIAAFAQLWTSINGPGSWERNPFVWVIEFRRLHD